MRTLGGTLVTTHTRGAGKLDKPAVQRAVGSAVKAGDGVILENGSLRSLVSV